MSASDLGIELTIIPQTNILMMRDGCVANENKMKAVRVFLEGQNEPTILMTVRIRRGAF